MPIDDALHGDGGLTTRRNRRSRPASSSSRTGTGGHDVSTGREAGDGPYPCSLRVGTAGRPGVRPTNDAQVSTACLYSVCTPTPTHTHAPGGIPFLA